MNNDRPCPDKFAIGSREWPGVSKLGEEAAEVSQVIFKLIGTGGDSNYWGDLDLRAKLIEETGDLLATIHYVMVHNGIANQVLDRFDHKSSLFRLWHDEEQDKLKKEITG